ncbi:shikimate dehydrogenase [Brachyspira sp.]|uniref:shikimate dehydrogenase n=1 Tax=Brachyspira sp. TaxID=1977261 RepID=UPI003D7E3FD4
MQIDSKTILTGLFASPSAHSISPIIHNNAFEKLGLNYAYLSFEVGKDNLKDAIQSIKTLNMRGVNLSMPNKKEVIQYLDEISETAELSQSVNTIVNDNGILKGYSTDGKGFFKSLEEEKIFIKDKNITILGMGGASIAIISQAIFEGIKNIFVFKRDKNWEEQKKILDNIASKTNCNIELNSLEDKNILKRKIEESDLLINATSVGMKENISLIEDKNFFRKDLTVCDIIYNPAKTKLLQIAEKEGCKIINGIGMLLYQGALSFELWTNKKMPVDYIKEIIFNHFK